MCIDGVDFMEGGEPGLELEGLNAASGVDRSRWYSVDKRRPRYLEISPQNDCRKGETLMAP